MRFVPAFSKNPAGSLLRLSSAWRTSFLRHLLSKSSNQVIIDDDTQPSHKPVPASTASHSDRSVTSNVIEVLMLQVGTSLAERDNLSGTSNRGSDGTISGSVGDDGACAATSRATRDQGATRSFGFPAMRSGHLDAS